MTTMPRRLIGALGESAAGTASVAAYLTGVLVGWLTRHAPALALLAVAISSATCAHRSGSPHR